MVNRTYGLFENDTNKRLIARLKERDAEILLFPQVLPVPAPISAAAGQAPGLAEFDWIIFPDLYSVDFFIDVFRAEIEEKFILDELRICALGEAVSDRLRFSRIHADIVPAERDVSTVCSSIAAYQIPTGLKFLISARAGESLALSQTLEENGAAVKALPVYEMKEVPDLPRLRTLLGGGAVDEFIFTSPQDVFDLAYFFAPDKTELIFSATDEITFQTLQEFGLDPIKYGSVPG